MQGARDAVGLIEVEEDLARSLIIRLADLGQAHFAGRAVEKARTEPVLERLDMVAHHGDRHVEPSRRSGEASALDDLPKHGEARQSIHRLSTRA